MRHDLGSRRLRAAPRLARAPNLSVALLRHLDTARAQRRVRDGCSATVARAATADPALLNGWFRLRFNVAQLHGLRDRAAHRVSVPDPRIEMCRMPKDDGAFRASFSRAIWQQQVAAPTWACTDPERADELPNWTPTR